MTHKQIALLIIGAVAFYFLFIKKYRVEIEYTSNAPTENQKKILYGK